MFSQDLRDQQTRQGSSGRGLSPTEYNQLQAMQTTNGGQIGVFDPWQDYRWAGDYDDSRAKHTYFDYYFTGQDIQVYIDGIDRPDPDADIPIMSFAYSAQQQKQPVYGFWNYTYNTVMRGTRIVNGAFTIATTSTDYMTRLVSKAASERAHKNASYVIRGLDKDERNIEQYWSRNVADDTAYGGSKSLFSSHPPFNFVIVYGVQSTSVTNNGNARLDEVIEQYRNDTPLMTDINERLVASDPNNAMRTVIENVEITGVQVELNPDGQVCAETYQFFARDIINPKLTSNYVKKKKSGAVN
jgi:hypothetical protein